MAFNQRTPRTNRYKKSGKGGFVLTALIIAICVLLAGGYLVEHYHKANRTVTIEDKTKKNPATPLQPVPQHSMSTAYIEAVPLARQESYYTGDIKNNNLEPPLKLKKRRGTDKAKLAIVVDDMGSSMQEAISLAAISVPINFAVIPGLRHDRDVADYAKSKGIVQLVHIPMQPKEYPRRRIEKNGLLLEHSDEELRSRVNGFLEMLPDAAGANNHMGSGFTEDSEKMRVVLELLKKRGLFYLDSITTPHTSGIRVASELNMHYARRNVFLDNEQNDTYIRGQLEKAVAYALKNGHAIAICHPHKVTIETLSATLPGLRTKGVELVSITELIN